MDKCDMCHEMDESILELRFPNGIWVICPPCWHKVTLYMVGESHKNDEA